MLLSLLSSAGYHAEKDVTSAFLPHAASVSLHEALGPEFKMSPVGEQVSIAYDKSSASKADILLLSPKGG